MAIYLFEPDFSEVIILGPERQACLSHQQIENKGAEIAANGGSGAQ